MKIDIKHINLLDTTAHDMLIALDDCSLLVCRVDDEGYIVDINKMWEIITGFKKDSLYDKKFIEFIHKDDIKKSIKAYKGSIVFHEDNPNIISGFLNRYKTTVKGKYAKLKWFGSNILVNGTHLSFASFEGYESA